MGIGQSGAITNGLVSVKHVTGFWYDPENGSDVIFFISQWFENHLPPS